MLSGRTIRIRVGGRIGSEYGSSISWGSEPDSLLRSLSPDKQMCLLREEVWTKNTRFQLQNTIGRFDKKQFKKNNS